MTILVDIGKLTQDFDHPLVHFDEGRMFGWSAPLPHMGMQDNHQYIVEPIDERRCRMIQSDEFRGRGSWFLGGMRSRAALKTCMDFDRALKERAETTREEAVAEEY